MFPEHRDLITRLKTSDAHFLRMFEHHNALDQQIARMENLIEPVTSRQIEDLKKEKLALKDSLYAILRKAANPS